MRAVIIILVGSLTTLPALAQAGPATITRDQFIQRATTLAGRRFDAIDVDHRGAITREQLRAYRQAHPLGGQAGQGSFGDAR